MPKPRGSRPVIWTAVLLFASFALAQDFQLEDPENLVCRIETSEGDILVELFVKRAPETVKNFVELAEGKREFKDAEGNHVTKPFYDGLIFHRVIDNFMIQGGCPLGNGRGDPGYSFADEINPEALGLHEIKAVDAEGKTHPWLLIRSRQDFERVVLKPLCDALGITDQEQLESRQEEVEKALMELSLRDVYVNLGYGYDEELDSVKPLRGTLAMANSGPDTNGSQFFISLVDNDYLSGKHTVFGKVIQGMDVVEAIGKVETDSRARPLSPVTILRIRLVDESE